MISQTLGDVRAAVARVCGATGMSVTDPRVIDRINEAQLELMNEGDFPGVVDRWHIIANNGNIVLPSFLDRLMQISIAGVPRTIKSPWFEFVGDGPGPVEDRNDYFRFWCDYDGILDRGESPTQVQLPEVSCGSSLGAGSAAGYFIRLYTTVTETPEAYATVQGFDGDGLPVRSQISSGSMAGEWINGEQLPISVGSSFYQTNSRYSSLTAFTKPATNGFLRLTAWDGVNEIALSTYAPNETTPSYRCYYSPWLNQQDGPCCRVVRARCRRRFVPVEELTDVLIISNKLAIKEMVIAQFKREAGNGDEYALHKQTAVDLLKKEASAYRGKSRIPALTMQRGTSIGALPGLR